jgi:hypothetical protein
MTDLGVPVCRHCGSDELHAIESRIEWRYVDWIRDPATQKWVTGNNWGDEVGDSTSDTVGIVCGGCNAEVACEGYSSDKWDAADLIVTREEYEATHPVKEWIVPVERIIRQEVGDHATRYPMETGERRVMARDAREARDLAGESGMQPDGSYPWRPSYPASAVPA